MTTYAIKVDTDNKIEIVEFDPTKSYETIKEAVGGGLFDCVPISSLGVDMWIDDEGKLVDEPVWNAFATSLWVKEYGMTDAIAGDVIITGGTDEDGNTLGISKDKAIELLMVVRETIDFIIKA